MNRELGILNRSNNENYNITEHDIEMGGAAHDENEDTRPIFTPTAKSRVVRIVQKHTNV